MSISQHGNPKDIEHHVLVDAQDKESPHPTILAGLALQEMGAGQILKLITNNEGSLRNIRIYADSMGHEVIRMEKLYGVITFWIRKNENPTGTGK